MKAKRVNPIIIAVVAVIAAGIIAYLFVALHAGIRVTITNADIAPLRSVTLQVTGNSYRVGDIAAGESAQATIHVKSESNLKIDLADDAGTRTQLDAGGYLEPGYRGTIHITIKGGEIVDNQQQVTVGLP